MRFEYAITVREHASSEVLERETAAGNTLRTAETAKQALVRQLELQYPPEQYSIDVRGPERVD
jgi:hypothetical protein